MDKVGETEAHNLLQVLGPLLLYSLCLVSEAVEVGGNNGPYVFVGTSSSNIFE